MTGEPGCPVGGVKLVTMVLPQAWLGLSRRTTQLHLVFNRAREQHRVARFHDRPSEADGQVRLADTRRAEDQHVFRLADEAPGGQLAHQPRIDRRLGCTDEGLGMAPRGRRVRPVLYEKAVSASVSPSVAKSPTRMADTSRWRIAATAQDASPASGCRGRRLTTPVARCSTLWQCAWERRPLRPHAYWR